MRRGSSSSPIGCGPEYGASPSAIGQTIRIHNQPYTIVGVAPATFTGMVPLLAPEVWTAMAYVDEMEPGGIISTVPSPTGNTRLERRGTRWMFVKGRLKPDATSDAAAANLNLIGKRLQTTYEVTNKRFEVSTVPTRDVHIHPVADRMLRPIGLDLMLVVGLVLVIACANVASMLLARASGRQKEIGIRLAIGASRGRLIQQLLSESIVMSTLGAAAGVALAWMLTTVATSISLPIPIPLSFALRIDGRVLLFTAGVTMFAALIAGLAPALKATRPNLVNELKSEVSGTHAGGRRWTMRDGLVVTQIAVTMVLLVAAGLLTRSLIAAQRVDVGFQTGGLAILSTELSMLGYDDGPRQGVLRSCARAEHPLPRQPDDGRAGGDDAAAGESRRADSVARRTREIGIRMALGARPAAVVGLVMKQGLALAAVGVGAGALLSLGAAKAVAGALYGVSFIDPIAWSGAIVLLFTVSALANLVPARRASVVDPSGALRSE